MPEEKLLHPEEVADANWSDAEIPEKDRDDSLRTVSKEIRRAVRRAHYGLGHPARQTLVRMLKLGGASPAAMKYAKKWK